MLVTDGRLPACLMAQRPMIENERGQAIRSYQCEFELIVEPFA